MEKMARPNKQTLFNFVVLVPIFLVFSLLLSRWYDGRKMDFGAYWQAGHMILVGQNVYDSATWIKVRNQEGTALHSEPTFQYPLPFAILFSLPALLPIQLAYTIWMFLAQVAILVSIVILLRFYPQRTGYFELLTITGIFFFRPMFSIVNSGQILALLVLLISLSIWLFHQERWFLGGFILSVLSLKPSIGFPMLVLIGFWLLFGKHWRGIWGMIAGGLLLVAIGELVNYRWMLDYLPIGGNSFSKYYGMHPTLWGAVVKIFGKNGLSLEITLVCVVVVLLVELYFFWRSQPALGPFAAFATILPAALLMAPYSWNYDQVLLVIPIVFLLIRISTNHGFRMAVLFMLGIVMLALGLVMIAYQVKHDVWSVITSLVVWLFSLYFVSRDNQSFTKNTYVMDMPSTSQ